MDWSSLLSGGGGGKTTSSVAQTELNTTGGSIGASSKDMTILVAVGAGVLVLFIAVIAWLVLKK